MDDSPPPVGPTARTGGPGPPGGAVDRAWESFRRLTGHPPEGVWSAPGRVNLIGEHLDYNGGCVLPFAIPRRAAAAVGRRRDGWLRAVTLRAGMPELQIPVTALQPGSVTGWGAYVGGVVWAMRRAGYDLGSGVDVVIDSAVPPGSGLSSSAALECALALALHDLSTAAAVPDPTLPAGVTAPAYELARLAQAAENDFVGVPCGPMDQVASMGAATGRALYFDVGSGRTEHVPLEPAAAGLALVVIDSHVRHSLADGAYADRRRSCEQAAARLGVDSLRQISPTDLDGALRTLAAAPELARRTRHVVTEQARVEATVELLRRDRLPEVGPLLDQSHLSLRHDFQVSTPDLDAIVAAARRAGAAGARLTGAGFGGSVVALVPADGVEAVAEAVAATAGPGRPAPTTRRVTPCGGARRDRRA